MNIFNAWFYEYSMNYGDVNCVASQRAVVAKKSINLGLV